MTKLSMCQGISPEEARGQGQEEHMKTNASWRCASLSSSSRAMYYIKASCSGTILQKLAIWAWFARILTMRLLGCYYGTRVSTVYGLHR